MWCGFCTNLDVSGVHNGSCFAFSLPLSVCRRRRSAAGVANLRGLSVRSAAATAAPLLLFPLLGLLFLLSAAVKGSVTGILSTPILAVNEAAQVLALERFPIGGVSTNERELVRVGNLQR